MNAHSASNTAALASTSTTLRCRSLFCTLAALFLSAGSLNCGGDLDASEDLVNDGIDEDVTAETHDELNTINLALGKPTIQSGTGFGGDSSRAVDGNTDGNFGHGSVSHTAMDIPGQFWQVDLESVQSIGEIVIHNRTDCCAEKINGLTVFVSSDGQTWEQFAPSNVPSTQMFASINRYARYVFLMNTNGYLHLAEVQVFAGSAINYTPFQTDFCHGENALGEGVRQHSAILWGIPSGVSWENTCAATSVTVNEESFSRADRCSNAAGHMWGEVDVIDDSCNVDRAPIQSDIASLMGVSALQCNWSTWTSDGCSNPLNDDVSKIYRDRFNSACVFHDYCYASPWDYALYGRAACDWRFYTRMLEICGSSDPACQTAAAAYYVGVTVGGISAYNNAQAVVANGRVTCAVTM